MRTKVHTKTEKDAKGKPAPKGHWVTHEGRHLFVHGETEASLREQAAAHRVAKEKAKPQKEPNAKESLAKKRRLASEQVEKHVAKMTGGKRITGNKPSDVDVPKVGGGMHKIEVKSKTFGSKKNLSVHPGALADKARDAKANPDNVWHTVLIDKRDTSEGGSHKASYSGHGLYYKRAVGAYSVKSMHKVKDEAELNRLIGMKDSELPNAARGKMLNGLDLKRPTFLSE